METVANNSFFIFALILGGIILYVIIKSISGWAYNQSQPQISSKATLIAKRMNVSGGGGNSSTFTKYYLSFEFEDGNRKEFKVNGKDYGLLREDDQGTLISQGNSFVTFERN